MADSNSRKQWVILELIQWTSDYFRSKGIQSPRLTAELLLAHALDVERISLYTNYDKPLDSQELATFKRYLQRRIQGEPTQYITGKQEFWSMEFTITPDVLIPRPDTEVLVETALRLFRGMEPVTLVDIGTGSGNIAIALAKELKGSIIYASDVSEKALQVARYNAEKLLENPNKIIFLKGDLWEPFSRLRLNSADGLRFNGILSNPPYLSRKDFAELAPEVGQHEPQIALLGGEDGLAYYHRLFSTSAEHLYENGYLIVEIGFGQRDSVLQMIKRTSLLSCCEVVKDYAGIDRVIVARKVDCARQ